jgi:uncharacterized cofD-like protein
MTNGAEGGPRVVAIGGGHGLAASLRAARLYAGDLTGIVSVADDGGSSGRLRRDLGIVPPGDLRKCLVALSEEDSVRARLLAAAFEHRFESDELAGHPLGNLVIAALAATAGGLQEALDEAARLLGCKGRVIPAATDPVQLKADAEAGEILGQTAVMRTPGIRHVSVVPEDVQAPAQAIEAIAEADQVIIGPGSLYTSVLAALAVPEMTAAVAKCSARRVYVANLRPQRAETAGYDLAAHVSALMDHGVVVDVVLADTSAIALGDTESLGVEVVQLKLAKTNGLAHDPGRLSGALAGLVA